MKVDRKLAQDYWDLMACLAEGLRVEWLNHYGKWRPVESIDLTQPVARYRVIEETPEFVLMMRTKANHGCKAGHWFEAVDYDLAERPHLKDIYDFQHFMKVEE